MSADRLREAARVLRERAEAATPGPWQGRDGASWAAQVCVLDGDGHPVAATSMTESDPSAIADAAYIATMHPGVGLALADWLDALAARGDEITESMPLSPSTVESVCRNTIDGWTNAQRTADLILGGTP